MSFVTIIRVISNKIKLYNLHYREAKALLNGVKDILPDFTFEKDAGYILIDQEKDVIVNGQDAFEMKNPTAQKGGVL